MPLRKAVEFQPNQPVQITLKYGMGKIIPTRNGADRVMFTLDDERVWFSDLGLAQRVNELKLKAREPILVTKVCRRNEAAAWTIEKANGASDAAPAPIPTVSQTPNTTTATIQPSKPAGWPVFLLAQTNELIDVYAQACEHAKEKGVPPAVVRTLLLSSFIQISRGGHV